jgi:hypothetical protein
MSRLQSHLLRLCTLLVTAASMAGAVNKTGSPWGH